MTAPTEAAARVPLETQFEATRKDGVLQGAERGPFGTTTNGIPYTNLAGHAGCARDASRYYPAVVKLAGQAPGNPAFAKLISLHAQTRLQAIDCAGQKQKKPQTPRTDVERCWARDDAASALERTLQMERRATGGGTAWTCRSGLRESAPDARLPDIWLTTPAVAMLWLAPLACEAPCSGEPCSLREQASPA